MMNIKNLKNNPFLHKLLRYAIWWGLGALIDLVALRFFTDVVGIYYLISSVLAFCISVSFGYFFQKYITFQDHQNKHLEQLTKFAVFQGIGQLINMALLRLLVSHLGWRYLGVAVINKAIIFIRNFVMNQLFNFSSPKK